MCLRAVISQRLVRNTKGKLVPAVEILLNTSLIADLIKNDEIDKIREAIGQSVSPGSQTFEQALYKLYKAGMITREEALLNADSASNISSLIDYGHAQNKAKAAEAGSAKPGIQTDSGADFGGIVLNLDTHSSNF